MCKLLIFGGTTEGRELAQFCAEHGICADVSVTTDYGARLLPESECIGKRTGKLDAKQIGALLTVKHYSLVIDATHPYAVLATEAIRSACALHKTPYFRLIRESESFLSGTAAENMDALVECLNKSNAPILSTLGSNALPKLTEVKEYAERLWIRILPADGITEYCTGLGFDKAKIILGRGPFSLEENIRHIELSGAEILVTKQSGKTGGYPEKVRAAAACGIALVTVKRPVEQGFSMEEIQNMILEKSGECK